MSKFSDALVCHTMRQRFSLPNHIGLDFVTDLLPPDVVAMSIGERFSLRATVEIRFAVDLSAGELEIERAKSMAKKQLVWFFFEEFRKPIWEIRNALMNYEVNEAQKLLSALEEQVFSR